MEPHKLKLQDGGVCSETSNSSAISTRFANPVGDDEVKAIQGAAVPANAQKFTTWALKVWKDWSARVLTVDWLHHLIGLYICSYAQDGSSTDGSASLFWK